jgi:nucleoside-diphosphate-sugar epimerase
MLLTLYVLYALTLSVALGFAGHRARAEGAGAAGGPARPARVFVVGATGGTGRCLVAQALEAGYAVTAFVRDPAKVGIEHPQLTVVRGDVLDERAVEAAMHGHDAVLCALGHKRWLGPTRILSQGTRNVLRAMQACGARRLVCETSLGIGDSAGRLGLYYTFFVVPVILPFYYWDKTRQERLIERSDVDWVIVRPGVLTDGASRGRWRSGRVGSFFATVRIARADVAQFMLEQLASDRYLRAAPGLCW